MSIPSVGIFWGIRQKGKPLELLADLVPLDRAEAYGLHLTHGGHYEYWEGLAALGAGELVRRGLPTVPVWSEYEEWPRGRVVYHVPTGQFTIYVDPKLRQQSSIMLIVNLFGLMTGSFSVEGDLHYVSSRNIRD